MVFLGLAAIILLSIVQTAFALNPLVVYTESSTSTDDILNYSTFSSSWSTGAAAVDTNDTAALTWHLARTSPTGRESVVLAMGSSSKTLYASLYNGSTWSGGGGAAPKNLGTLPPSPSGPEFRRFSAAYELASGDLLIVAASTTSNQIKYWVWNGTSWTVDGATYTFTTVDKTIHWIELASQPNTNQIALMAVDYDSDVVGLIWEGACSSWGNEKKLGTITTYDTEGFDVEYMQTGTNAGKALFVWGQTTTLYSWTWTGAAWEAALISKASAATGNIRWLTLAADPGSDDILVALSDDSRKIYTVNWTGSVWGTRRDVETSGHYGSVGDHRPYDIIFEATSGHSGHAIIVYSGDYEPGYTGLVYRHTTDIATGWPVTATVEWVDVGKNVSSDCYWVELARASDGAIHLAVHEYRSSTDYLCLYRWYSEGSYGSNWTGLTNVSISLYEGSNTALHAFALTAQPGVGCPEPSPVAAVTPPENSLLWSPNTATYLYDYRWNSGDWTYQSMPDLGVNLEWVVAKTSPVKNEKIVIGATNSTWNLHGAIWNGSTWSTKDFGNIYASDYRWFDVAIETMSGNIMVVASSGTSLKYWIWDGSTWVVNGATISLSLGSGYKNWVKLAPNPRSNEIAMVFLDSLSDVYGAIWNGTTNSWGNEQTLETAASTSANECIAVEYMQSGSGAGKAMFVWGTSTNFKSRVWSSSAWEAVSSAYAVGGTPSIVTLKADPNSSRLALAVIDGGYDLNVFIYDGSTWSTSSPWALELNTSVKSSTTRCADVIFETASGHEGDLLAVYSISTTLYYRHADWNGSTYSWGSQTTLVASTSSYWMQLERSSNHTVLLAFDHYVDLGYGDGPNYALKSYSWTPSTWTSEGALESVLASTITYGMPFMITSSLPPTLPSANLTQVGYRWFNDNGPEKAGVSVVSSTSGATGGSGASSLTLSNHSVSGSNRLLMVGISYWPDVTPVAIQSVTWNGQNLTYVGGRASSTFATTAIYKLEDPPVATSDVVITFDNWTGAVAGAITFDGVNLSSPLGTVSSNNSTTSSASTTVTTTAGDLVFAVAASNAKALTLFNGDTQHWSQLTTYSAGAGGTELATGASTTVSWTVAAGTPRYWAISGVPVKPASLTAATSALGENQRLGIAKGEVKRLRFLVSNTGKTDRPAFVLQVAETGTCGSGTYVDVSQSTHWQMENTSYYGNTDSSSHLAAMTPPANYTFAAGELKDGSCNTCRNVTLGNEQYTEVEFALKPTACATSGGNYCFRLVNAHTDSLNTYTTYAQAQVTGVTAVKLIDFKAVGSGAGVRVQWVTAQEVDNKGFNLYRADNPAGPFLRVNQRLIPGNVTCEGATYEVFDEQVTAGRLYYYKLEDVDVSGTVTPHGPVCVDWDGDGIPDDWEIVYGLNPGVNDANLDSDGDGVPNWLEYQRGTDPFNADTDGDGIADGAEKKN
ncbi:MAG TPA: hypothetical protein DCZ69_16020, partial [Syntrophobacteraceae bacterium]|nr:hypothetical protein [Syntrophobacteraceae bacterium]